MCQAKAKGGFRLVQEGKGESVKKYASLLRADKEGSESAFIQGQGLVNLLQQPFLVLGKPACQVDVVGIVITGESGPALEMLKELSRFQEYLVGRKQLKSSFFDLMQQKRVDLRHQGPEPHKVGLDGVQHAGCCQSVFL